MCPQTYVPNSPQSSSPFRYYVRTQRGSTMKFYGIIARNLRVIVMLLVSFSLTANFYAPVIARQSLVGSLPSGLSYCVDQSGGNTLRMQECLRIEYDKQDRTLNITYKRVKQQLKSKYLRQRLVGSQRVWIWRRDSECSAKTQASPLYGGSATQLLYQDCRIEMVRERIQWLKKVPQNPGYLTKV